MVISSDHQICKVLIESYFSHAGIGSLHLSEPYTFDLVVFDLEDSSSRRHMACNGGWPAFTPDSKSVYFHRKCEDGWWSIFKAEVRTVGSRRFY